jgi:hypothetical protein
MRYPIRISPLWLGLFALFGFPKKRSYAEIDGQALHFHFGTAHERIPIGEITSIAPRRWPLYFGLGAKYGPDGGVAYVGSREGVVQIDFAQPRPMNVWGPFHASHARCVIVSIEDADRFIADLRERIGRA